EYGIRVQEGRGFNSPSRILEENVAVQPGHLGTFRWQTRKRDVQQPFLLPHDIPGSNSNDRRRLGQCKCLVAERALYHKVVQIRAIYYIDETLIVPRFGPVPIWIEEGADDPQVARPGIAVSSANLGHRSLCGCCRILKLAPFVYRHSPGLHQILT